jgi:hypothetical protein
VVHVYHELAWRGRTFRIVEKGALGLGLIMVYLNYEFLLQGMRLRVV